MKVNWLREICERLENLEGTEGSGLGDKVTALESAVTQLGEDVKAIEARVKAIEDSAPAG